MRPTCGARAWCSRRMPKPRVRSSSAGLQRCRNPRCLGKRCWRCSMPPAIRPAPKPPPQRLLRPQPGHPGARLQVLEGLMGAGSGRRRRAVGNLAADRQGPGRTSASCWGCLGLATISAGRPDKAVEAWSKLQQELAPSRAAAAAAERAQSGLARAGRASRERTDSGVPVRCARFGAWSGWRRSCRRVGEPFRSDRFGPCPPQDGFQAYAIIDGLLSGEISGAGSGRALARQPALARLAVPAMFSTGCRGGTTPC